MSAEYPSLPLLPGPLWPEVVAADRALSMSKKNVYRAISLLSRVFTNDPEDWGSIPGRVIPKTQKMVLYAALLNT